MKYFVKGLFRVVFGAVLFFPIGIISILQFIGGCPKEDNWIKFIFPEESEQ